MSNLYSVPDDGNDTDSISSYDSGYSSLQFNALMNANLLRYEACQLHKRAKEISPQSQYEYFYGCKSKAKKLSLIKNGLYAKRDQKNNQAAELIFKYFNQGRPDNVIDLQRLYIEEALEYLQQKISKCSLKDIFQLEVITGEGPHNIDLIKPQIAHYAQENNLTATINIVLRLILYIHSQVLYECDFDDSVHIDHCFTTSTNIIITPGVTIPSDRPPSTPMSDVTSSLKPTKDGKVCVLPYKIENFTWDMYFCNRGYCPTASNLNSTCASGQFGSVILSDFTIKSFKLKTDLNGINGTNEQCLIYYYYLSNITRNSITIIKEEMNSRNQTIDYVTSSPFNGWIQRKISFFAETSNYNIFFNIQKISGSQHPHAGLDEISIHQDNCTEDIMTTDSTTIITTLEDTTTVLTSIPFEQSTPGSSSVSVLTSVTSIIPMTTDITSTIPLSTKSVSNTLTTISEKTTMTSLSIVETTQEEDNFSETSQLVLSTQHEKLTITITNVTTQSTETLIITNMTVTLQNDMVSSKKIYIIVLSTVIPTIMILSIISLILFKRSSSTNILRIISRPFTNLNKNEKSIDNYELDQMRDEYTF